MKRIVIVDDHPAILIALRHALTLAGEMEVVGEADNGQTAVERVRALQPDLVVIDVDIPRINGLDLIERIRGVAPAAKVLVLSALSEDVYAARALQAGANGYLSKTQHMTAIRHAAASVMSGYNMFPASAMQKTRPADGTPVSPVDLLSDREITVLRMLVAGRSNMEIADALFISNKTVSTYKSRLMEKLHAKTLVELIDFARQHRVTE